MVSFSSYFNPVSDQHHALQDFDSLKPGQKFGVVLVTALATLVTLPFLGVGGLVVFRALTERYSVKHIKIGEAGDHVNDVAERINKVVKGNQGKDKHFSPNVFKRLQQHCYHAALSHLDSIAEDPLINSEYILQDQVEVLKALGNRIIFIFNSQGEDITNLKLLPLLKLYWHLENKLEITDQNSPNLPDEIKGLREQVKMIQKTRNEKIEADQLIINELMKDNNYREAIKKLEEMAYAGYDIQGKIRNSIIESMAHCVFNGCPYVTDPMILKDEFVGFFLSTPPYRNNELENIREHSEEFTVSFDKIFDEVILYRKTLKNREEVQFNKERHYWDEELLPLMKANEFDKAKKIVFERNYSNEQRNRVSDYHIIKLWESYGRINWVFTRDEDCANRHFDNIVKPFNLSWEAIPTEQQYERFLKMKDNIERHRIHIEEVLKECSRLEKR